jgi:hypothetical protein
VGKYGVLSILVKDAIDLRLAPLDLILALAAKHDTRHHVRSLIYALDASTPLEGCDQSGF